MQAHRLTRLRETKTYDLLAALPLVAVFGYGFAHQLPMMAATFRALAYRDDALAVATALAQAASAVFAALWMVLLLWRRRARARSSGILPRTMALAGTYLGVAILLLPATILPWQIAALSTMLILAGTAFSIYAIVYLGRSISIMAEARGLVTGGPYALTRHPLYVGEGLSLLGLALQYTPPMSLLLLALQWAFQLQRMRYEEAVLAAAFPAYADYMATTPRLLSRLSLRHRRAAKPPGYCTRTTLVGPEPPLEQEKLYSPSL